MTDCYQLLGAPASLYTGKVRAYLRFKDIPYREVLATRAVFQETILPKTGVRFIPVVLTPDGASIQDTTDIIDTLETHFPAPSVYPATPRQRLAALLFEVYGDEWLVMPAMHYRWIYNRDFIVGEFGKIAMPDADADTQRKAGEETAAYFSGSLPFLGITEDTMPEVEKSYEAFLAEFEAHLAVHPFLFGSRPSIGDFGLMGPLYAHLYRDPASGDLMRRLAPRVAGWVMRMNSPKPKTGDFLAGDEIPETLLPLLRRFFTEYTDILAGTVSALETWAGENEGPEIPRAIGTQRFTLGAASADRVIFPYTQWMFQRPWAFYHGAEEATRSGMDALLNTSGGRGMMDIEIRTKVTRKNNKLALDV